MKKNKPIKVFSDAGNVVIDGYEAHQAVNMRATLARRFYGTAKVDINERGEALITLAPPGIVVGARPSKPDWEEDKLDISPEAVRGFLAGYRVHADED